MEYGRPIAFDLETKAEVKETLREREDVWVLRGYCATFHDVDRVNDAIQPGAFAKCLDRMKSKGESLQLYLNHDLMVPIADQSRVSAKTRRASSTRHTFPVLTLARLLFDHRKARPSFTSLSTLAARF